MKVSIAIALLAILCVNQISAAKFLPRGGAQNGLAKSEWPWADALDVPLP